MRASAELTAYGALDGRLDALGRADSALATAERRSAAGLGLAALVVALAGGGRRQRLARVLLAGFPVVVLDEPVEHLDDPTAAELARDLLDAARGRTVLVLTHRPELFPGLDAVLPLVPALQGSVAWSS